MIENTPWLLSGDMASELGISVRTLHNYRTIDQSPWIDGRHYKRRTPADKSPWIWDRELTLKAWEEARKSVGGMA